MKISDDIRSNTYGLTAGIAKICGEFALNCSDAARLVSRQMDTAKKNRVKQNHLVDQIRQVFEQLSAIIYQVDQASEL